MTDKHVKTTEKPEENLRESPSKLNDAAKKSPDLPPQVRELVQAEEQEEQGVIRGTRAALAQLSGRLPPPKLSPEQKLERFVA